MIVTGGQGEAEAAQVIVYLYNTVHCTVYTVQVTVYNSLGWVEDWPGLTTGRHGHACGYFVNSDDEMVGGDTLVATRRVRSADLGRCGRCTWWRGATPPPPTPTSPPPSCWCTATSHGSTPEPCHTPPMASEQCHSTITLLLQVTLSS